MINLEDVTDDVIEEVINDNANNDYNSKGVTGIDKDSEKIIHLQMKDRVKFP